MTEIADDKSWWADVEHLRPGGEAAARTSPRSDARSGAVAEHPRPTDDEPVVRRGRITQQPIPAAPAEKPAVMRRSDAAAFADAMDLDGAFGAPVAISRSREIVLSRTHDDVEDVVAVAPDDERPAAQGSPDRQTVRITGNPGIHADLAERRALREVQVRRPRSAVARAVHRPDRIAMWVVLLGLFLVLIAATSSSAGAA